MAVASNLPRNVNILETFDDNELLKKVLPLVLEVIPTPNLPLIIYSFSFLLFKFCFILYFTVFYDCFVQHFGQCKLNLNVLYK